MTAQTPIEFQHLLRYEPTYGILICCLLCKTAVGKTRLPQHLRDRHTILAKERKSLMTALDSLSIIESEDCFPQPADFQDPIIILPLHDAYKCKGCDFISKNDTLIHRHCAKTHPEIQHSSSASSNTRWQRVKVQQWVVKGKAAKYWIVRTGLEVASLSLTSISTDSQESLEGLSWEDLNCIIVEDKNSG
jgi:hypothetical protein